jgi:hypothetical protein
MLAIWTESAAKTAAELALLVQSALWLCRKRHTCAAKQSVGAAMTPGLPVFVQSALLHQRQLFPPSFRRGVSNCSGVVKFAQC